MARGPVSTGPLSGNAQRLLDAEIARSSRRGPATANSVRGRRAAARKSKAAAEAALEALHVLHALRRSGVKAPRKPRAKGTRTKTSYPLTQRGQAAAARAGSSKSSRAKARKTAIAKFRYDQAVSQHRRLEKGEAALTKEEIKARRKALPTTAQARAELRAAETRARGRAFTAAEVVKQEVRNLHEETAVTRDSIAKLKIAKKYGDSQEARELIAEIEAKANRRTKKAAAAAAKRAGIVGKFTAAESFTYVKKPSKPREPGAKRTYVPKPKKSERSKKLSRLAAQMARLQAKI